MFQADSASVFKTKHLRSLVQTLGKKPYTLNIYRYKTIEANGNTGIIPTTRKFFSLHWELLQPLWVIYQKNGSLPIEAKGIAGNWNDTGISISLYSFVTIDIYSVIRYLILMHGDNNRFICWIAFSIFFISCFFQQRPCLHENI